VRCVIQMSNVAMNSPSYNCSIAPTGLVRFSMFSPGSVRCADSTRGYCLVAPPRQAGTGTALMLIVRPWLRSMPLFGLC